MSHTAAEPLINSHDTNDDADLDRDDARHSEEAENLDVDESQLVRPGAFMWALTLCAGISGLLFGYEYVSLTPSFMLQKRPATTQKHCCVPWSFYPTAYTLFAASKYLLSF